MSTCTAACHVHSPGSVTLARSVALSWVEHRPLSGSVGSAHVVLTKDTCTRAACCTRYGIHGGCGEAMGVNLLCVCECLFSLKLIETNVCRYSCVVRCVRDDPRTAMPSVSMVTAGSVCAGCKAHFANTGAGTIGRNPQENQ